jgi:hypothetical protein
MAGLSVVATSLLMSPILYFEICLDSNPGSFRSKQARYQLSHPYPSRFICNPALLTCMNAAGYVPQAWPFDWGRVGANQQDNGITRIEKAGSERELLSLFLSKLQKLDPDIIIGEFERGPTGTSRFFYVGNSVADPDPPDPHAFGPPGSGS